MSSSPRSRATRTAIFALSVGAAIIVVSLLLLAFGVDVLEIGDTFVTGLFPPIAVTSQGAQIRDLYTIVFLIAVAIFIVVEGLIIWTVIRYRRKPGDDTLPPQTHGNNIAEFVWTVVPTLIVIFMFIVSWQTLNAVDTSAPTPRHKIRAVAGQFQWQFDYLVDQDGKTVLYTEFIPLGQRGRRDDGPGRPDGPALRSSAKTSSTPSTSRSSCSSATSCRADQPVRLHRRRGRCRPDVPRPVRRAVRHRPPHHAVRGQRADAGRLRRMARRQGRRSAQRRRRPPRRPSGGRRRRAAARPAERRRRSDAPAHRQRRRLRADGARPPRPARRSRSSSTTRTRASPHNVAIHKDSPTGDRGLQGRDLPGRRHEDLRRPGRWPAGTYAFVCTVHPNDDRHPHGPVRSHSMATTTLTPAASAYRSALYDVADDDRSQEDRDHVRRSTRSSSSSSAGMLALGVRTRARPARACSS